MMRADLVVLFAAAPLLALAAAAQAAPRADFPSPGSVAELPPGTAPAPLLVVLHGDGQSPRVAFAAWAPAAASRGFAVAALACPKHAGCKGSFWQWDGDPSWLDGEIDALARARPIDRTRLFAVGWSGGASWMGWRAQAFAARFAALVHWGGGIPPADAACEPAVPTYFLVGDANPLHHLAVRLRDHHTRCGHEVLWDLVKGADHAGEERALGRAKADAIVAWLEAHPSASATATATASASASASASAPASATATASASAPASTVPPRPAPAGRCACDAAPLAMLAFLARRRQRGGGGRSTPVAGSGSH